MINTKSKKTKPWTHTASSFPWVIPGMKRQNIWSSLIYSLFCALPFVQELWSSLIYFFYLQTTIRPTYMILFHLVVLFQTTIRPTYMVPLYLFFLLCTTIWPNIRVLFNLFFFYLHIAVRPNIWYSFIYSFFCVRPFNQELWSSLISFFHFHTTILQRIIVLIYLFLLFAHDHSTKIYGLCSFISFIYTWPFGEYIWSSFIYSSFYKWPFDQNIWFSFIYSFFCKRPLDQNIWCSFI